MRETTHNILKFKYYHGYYKIKKILFKKKTGIGYGYYEADKEYCA